MTDAGERVARAAFRVLLYLVLIDPFGDSVLLSFGLGTDAFDAYTKLVITATLAVILCAGVRFVPKWSNLWTPFWLVLCVYGYALVSGLAQNVSVNAVNDFLSVTPIVVALALRRFHIVDTDRELRFLGGLVLAVVFLKYVLYQLGMLAVFGTPSWKVLLKQSPLLLFPYSIFLSDYVKAPRRRTGAALLLILYLIFTAQARMLFIGCALVTVVHLVRGARPRVAIGVVLMGGVAFGSYSVVQQMQVEESLLHWYGGEVFQEGVDYRLQQLQELERRVVDRPLVGVGLGYFDPDYLSYSELAKPYQLELDLPNFVTKVGLLMAFIYFLSYRLLAAQIRQVGDPVARSTLSSTFVALIGLLAYSTGQTFHQGYLFWVFYGIFYGYLAASVRRAAPAPAGAAALAIE